MHDTSKHIEILNKYLRETTYAYTIKDTAVTGNGDLKATVIEYNPNYDTALYELTVSITKDSVAILNRDGGNCIGIQELMDSWCMSREEAEAMYLEYVAMAHLG